MKALVIGSNGCAHALAWKLAQSPAVTALYSAPGNYGTNLVGANVAIPATDVDALAAWAKEQAINLTVVASAAEGRACGEARLSDVHRRFLFAGKLSSTPACREAIMPMAKPAAIL